MTKTIQTTTLTIDLLPPERLAWELATLMNSLPGARTPGDVGNVDRDRLESVATLLTEDPPMIAEALEEAQRGLAHAVRPDYTEDRPETYLLAAVVQALSRVDAAPAAGLLDAQTLKAQGAELLASMGLLGAALARLPHADAGDAAPLPALTDFEAAELPVLLKMASARVDGVVRWLVSLPASEMAVV